GNEWGPEMPVTAGPQLDARPALAADREGRVWIAWEIGPENWAGDSADGGLRVRRSIGLACWKDGSIYRLPDAAQKLGALWGESGAQDAVPVAGGDGKLWLFFRRPINKNLLQAGVTSWEGSGWAAPKHLLNSEGRIDQRLAVTTDGSGSVVACYPAGSQHNVIYLRKFEKSAGQAPTLAENPGATRPPHATPPLVIPTAFRPTSLSGPTPPATPTSPRMAASPTARSPTPCATQWMPPSSIFSASPTTPAICPGATICGASSR